MAKKDEEFKFEIVEIIERLTDKSDKGWIKLFSLVKWGDSNEPVYDIRNWKISDDDQPERCGKGISLSYDEVALLGQALYDKGIV